MSTPQPPQLSFLRRVINVFRFGRPTGKAFPADQFVDFFQNRNSPTLTVEEYMALRQRFSDEGFFRRERQSNVIGWVSGVMLAIMVALLQLIAGGQTLPWHVKLLMAVMVIVFAFISSLRVFHDHSVAQFRSDLCRQLDDRLKVKILDEQCKLPPALHKLFTVMIWILALGVVLMILFVNSPTHSTAKADSSAQISSATPIITVKPLLAKPGQSDTNTTAVPPLQAPTNPASPATVKATTAPSTSPAELPPTTPTSGSPKP